MTRRARMTVALLGLAGLLALLFLVMDRDRRQSIELSDPESALVESHVAPPSLSASTRSRATSTTPGGLAAAQSDELGTVACLVLAGGQAVPGARVALYALGPRGFESIAELSSGPDGVAAFKDVPLNRAGALQARAVAGASASDRSPVFLGVVTALELKAAAILIVRGVDAAKGVSGSLFSVDSGFVSLLERFHVSKGETQIELVVPPKVALRVQLHGTDAISDILRVDPLVVGEKRQVDARFLTSPIAVRVRLRERDIGVPKVTVLLDGHEVSTMTDSGGRAQMLPVDESRWIELGIAREGELLGSPAKIAREGDVVVLLVDQEIADASLLTVRVSDSLTGEPVPGAQIGWDGLAGAIAPRCSASGEDGRARAHVYPGYERAPAVVYHPSYVPEVFQRRATSAETSIRLSVEVPTRVVVKSAQGDPISHAVVRAIRTIDGGEATISIVSNDRGSLDVVLDGAWLVSARRSDGDATSPSRSPRPGEVVELVVPDEPESDLSGTVIGDTALVMLAERAAIFSGGRRFPPALIEGGRFRAHGTFGGHADIQVIDREGRLLGEYHGPTQAAIRIGLQRRLPVRLDVIGAEPNLRSARVLARMVGAQRWSEVEIVRKSDGSWVLEVGASGTWDLRVEAGDRSGEARGVEVHAESGGTAALQLRVSGSAELVLREIRAGTRVTVRVFRRGAGDLVPGERAAQPDARVAGAIGDDGVFGLGSLEPGVYTVIGSAIDGDHRSWVIAVTDLHVMPGRSTRAAAWTTSLRAIRLLGLAGISTRPLFIEPRGPASWIGRLRALELTAPPDANDAEILLWSGSFVLVDRSGVPFGSFDVASDASTAQLSEGR